jgi:hypothetical protein
MRLVFLIVITFGALGSASAQTGVGFPMIGIATGQTARINALNAGTAPQRQIRVAASHCSSWILRVRS